MTKDLDISTVVNSITDVANIDFSKVFEKAIEIFSDQAMLDKSVSDITIKDLEISKAKANNFLDAIAGVIEISHQVDVLSAERDKFRRKDELAILNSMRRTVATQTEALEKNAMIASAQLSKMMETPETIDAERLALLQSVLNSSIDVGSKLISSASKLIHLERHSGGKPWGSNRYGVGSIKTISELDKADSAKGKSGVMKGAGGGPRELSRKDIEALDE
jgi:hypothetical protein